MKEVEHAPEMKSNLRFIFIIIILSISISTIIILGSLIWSVQPEDLIRNLTDHEILFAIELSIITGVVSTALCLCAAIPAAYALARFNFRGKRFFSTITNLPLTLPPLVAGIALLIFFATNPAGKALEDLGLNIIFTPLGIIVAQFFVNVPYLIRVLNGTFSGINPRYEHIARTLGCTDAGTFWRVTLPMARRGIISGTVITWSKAMGEFGAVLMLAGATQMKTETLPIALFINMSTGNLNMAITAATILMGISLIILIIFDHLENGRDSHW